MKNISADKIYKAIVEMIAKSSTILEHDVYNALKAGYERETHAASKEIFRQLLENADYAAESKLPLCQDCGTAIFFVERGENVCIDMQEYSTLNEIINAAMKEAYDISYLRKSMCDPLTRKNTTDNSPAVIHTDIIKGETFKISFLAKGGGSENMSRVTMLSPSQGLEGIRKFVIERVAEAGPNPCPPIVVGIGIGATFESVGILAKKALMRPLKDKNPDPQLQALEEEYLERINKLGIGPMGLGGKTTALAVKIAKAPCHIASLPLAVNIQCHSIRHDTIEF